ncbi:MAG: type I restriction-modification system subunit M N-terminal domain-containing protein, partial [Bacteroidia bacterium]|nr:type I restriction-modification system subunit M N-terminal domain-containing protein [Bacteroidia bacterium]
MSLVLRIKFSGKNPARTQSRQPLCERHSTNIKDKIYLKKISYFYITIFIALGGLKSKHKLGETMANINNTREQERAELYRTIWQIANDLRGSVDGWDFKTYVLGMLFY